MTTLAQKTAPLPKTIADRYRVIDRLGAGGMATVYLAAMDGPGGFGKLVAIKRIHPHLAHESRFVEMFLDEARIVSRIDHPNVCSVLDFGQTEDTYFLAMEYIMGETLLSSLRVLKHHQDLLGTARWHAFTAYIIAAACEGLHSAHELADEFGKPLNIVHRDVSPDNIFMSYQGEVRVMDFGIARAEGRLHKTNTGVVKGKLSYMPPEMLNAEPDVDRRVDVWALGVCLWELLVGKPLFKRPSDAATIAAIAMETAAAPSQVNASVPAALDTIVAGALQRERDQRTASARELGRQLRRFISESGVAMDRIEVAEMIDVLHAESKAKKLAQRQSIQQQSGRLAAIVPPNLNSPEFAAQFDDLPTQSSEQPAPGMAGAATAAASSSAGLPMTMGAGITPGSGRVAVQTASAPGGLPPAAAVVSPPPAHGKGRRWLLPLVAVAALGLLGAGFGIATLRGGDTQTAAAPTGAHAGDNAQTGDSLPDDQPAGQPTGQPAGQPAGDDKSENPGAADTTDAADGKDTGETGSSESTGASAKRDDGERKSSSSRSRKRRERRRAKSSRDRSGDTGDGSAKNGGDARDSKTDTTDSNAQPAKVEPAKVKTLKPPPTPEKKLMPAPSKPKSFAAKAEISSIRTKGSLSSNTVKPAITRKQSALAACYKKAAEKAGRNAKSTVTVKFKIDESKRVHGLSATGAALPGLNGCVESVVKGIRSKQAPDVGDVRVSFKIAYTPVAK